MLAVGLAGSNSCKGQEKAGLKQEQPGKRARMLQAVPCNALARQSSELGGTQHILLQKCLQQPERSARPPFPI